MFNLSIVIFGNPKITYIQCNVNSNDKHFNVNLVSFVFWTMRMKIISFICFANVRNESRILNYYHTISTELIAGSMIHDIGAHYSTAVKWKNPENSLLKRYPCRKIWHLILVALQTKPKISATKIGVWKSDIIMCTYIFIKKHRQMVEKWEWEEKPISNLPVRFEWRIWIWKYEDKYCLHESVESGTKFACIFVQWLYRSCWNDIIMMIGTEMVFSSLYDIYVQRTISSFEIIKWTNTRTRRNRRCIWAARACMRSHSNNQCLDEM